MLTTERDQYPNGSIFYRVLMRSEYIGSFSETDGGYLVGRTKHETPADAVYAVLAGFIHRTNRNIADLEAVLERAKSERKLIKKHR